MSVVPILFSLFSGGDDLGNWIYDGGDYTISYISESRDPVGPTIAYKWTSGLLKGIHSYCLQYFWRKIRQVEIPEYSKLHLATLLKKIIFSLQPLRTPAPFQMNSNILNAGLLMSIVNMREMVRALQILSGSNSSNSSNQIRESQNV